MILGLEVRMHILEFAWSLWMQTYQFLAYQTDELHSQKSLVLAFIQKNPGTSLKQGQLKCYVCQVYRLYYYEYKTPISFWLSHYTKVILCHLACLYMSLQWCCQKKILTCFLLESFRKAFSDNSIASNPKTFMW